MRRVKSARALIDAYKFFSALPEGERDNGLMRDLRWAEEWLKGDSPTYPIL